MENPKLKYLENVPWDNSLKLSNGKTVHDLEQLPIVIKFSDDEVFYSHMNDQKNDFANWIRDVIGDDELATQLLSVRTKEEFLRFMDRAISDIKHYKAPEPVVQPVVSPAVPPNLSPIAPPIISPVVQPVISSVIQSVIPVPLSASQSIVFPPSQPVQEPLAKPASPPTQQQVQQLGSVATPKSNLFVSESQMVDAPSSYIVPAQAPVQSSVQPVPQPNIQPVPLTAQISNTVSQVIEKPSIVSVDKPVDSSLDKSVAVPAAITSDKSAATSENVAVPTEETFEYEEIFKALISELEQEVLTWDNQAS